MQAATHLPRYRLTVSDYHKMIEAGIFQEDNRVELIEGELIQMPPIRPAHAGKSVRLTHLFSRLAEEKALITVQNPVALSQHSEPQPDLALLRPRGDFYETSNPEPADILLLIEIADTSLNYDKKTKIPLYAHHGITEVWLLDLQHRKLEVYRQPGASGYRQILIPDEVEQVSPLLLPELTVQAGQLWGEEQA